MTTSAGPCCGFIHEDLVTMTRWMADNGFTPDQIAYAVEKPWKHLDVLSAAQGDELAAARLLKE